MSYGFSPLLSDLLHTISRSIHVAANSPPLVLIPHQVAISTVPALCTHTPWFSNTFKLWPRDTWYPCFLALWKEPEWTSQPPLTLGSNMDGSPSFLLFWTTALTLDLGCLCISGSCGSCSLLSLLLGCRASPRTALWAAWGTFSWIWNPWKPLLQVLGCLPAWVALWRKAFISPKKEVISS